MKEDKEGYIGSYKIDREEKVDKYKGLREKLTNVNTDGWQVMQVGKTKPKPATNITNSNEKTQKSQDQTSNTSLDQTQELHSALLNEKIIENVTEENEIKLTFEDNA